MVPCLRYLMLFYKESSNICVENKSYKIIFCTELDKILCMKDFITTPSPKVENAEFTTKQDVAMPAKRPHRKSVPAVKTRHCAKKERVHLPRRHTILRISDKRHIRLSLVAAQCKGKLLALFTYSETMKAPLSEQRFKDELLKLLLKAALS